MLKRLLVSTLMLASTLLARPAFATPFTWEFIGTVTGVDATPGGASLGALLPSGTSVIFSITHDDQTLDSCSALNRGFFSPLAGAVTVLGVGYASSSGGLEVSNPAGNCIGDGPVNPTQDYVERFVMDFGAPFSGAFLSWLALGSGDQLPSVLPTSATFQLNYVCGVVCTDGVFGEITEVRQVNLNAVPEPATGALMLTGLAVLAARLRFGRRSRS